MSGFIGKLLALLAILGALSIGCLKSDFHLFVWKHTGGSEEANLETTKADRNEKLAGDVQKKKPKRKDGSTSATKRLGSPVAKLKSELKSKEVIQVIKTRNQESGLKTKNAGGKKANLATALEVDQKHANLAKALKLQGNSSSSSTISLPNVLLIGIQKGGSTAVAEWLFEMGVCRAKIFPGDPTFFAKEPHFFDNPSRYNKGRKFYQKRYDHCLEKNKQFILDATPATFLFPERVHQLYKHHPNLRKDLKIIVSLREPVARELSFYNHIQLLYQDNPNSKKGFGKRLVMNQENNGTITFAEFVETTILNKPTSAWKYIHEGHYAQHLSTWLDLFDPKQVLVLSYETEVRPGTPAKQRIQEFLGHSFSTHDQEGEFPRVNTKNSPQKVRGVLCSTVERVRPVVEAWNEELYELLESKKPVVLDPFPKFEVAECIPDDAAQFSKDVHGLIPANEEKHIGGETTNHHIQPEAGLDLAKNKTVFFHLGKGGGGTVEEEMKEYHFPANICHPGPSTCHQHLRNGAEQVLINIRDPVDRFVSAFNWRALVLCGKNDPREKGSNVKGNPQHFCKTDNKERDILHQHYHYDVNELAESLCNEGRKGVLARKHVSAVEHMRHSLSDWLDVIQSSPWPSLQEIVALVMEPPLDFRTTTLHALEYLVEKEHLNLSLNASTMPDNTSKTMLHSSSSFQNMIPKFQPSALAKCCIARHLARDYELLKVMSGTATKDNVDPRLAQSCQWGTEEDSRQCRDSLHSMGQRRAPYLKDMSMSCQQVVNEEEER